MLEKAKIAFLRSGFEGTSIDELVLKTGLLRGSLYAAFDSKRGIFIRVLKQILAESISEDQLDILLIALLELAPRDKEIRQLLAEFIKNQENIAHKLGDRLLERANIHPNSLAVKNERTAQND